MILNGFDCAKRIYERLSNEVKDLPKVPKLAVYSIGNDKASQSYIKQKKLAADKIGIILEHINFDENTAEEIIYSTIYTHSHDDNVTAAILQLPIPHWMNEEHLLNAIPCKKDVDGFLPNNYYFDPCTPIGVLMLLDNYGLSVKEKHCVVIGRGKTVGKPLANILLRNNATVSIVHSKTPYYIKKELMSKADYIFSATGQGTIMPCDYDYISNKVLVDIGIQYDASGKMHGDFSPECYRNCKAYTPVPKGVGPMTVAALMENTVDAMRYELGRL